MDKSTLWICRDQDAAIKRADAVLAGPRLSRFISPDHRQRIIWPGCAICGAGFDEIILDDVDPYAHDVSAIQSMKMREWFNSAIYCRLLPGGQIKTLKLFEAQL